jgi:putative transposase
LACEYGRYGYRRVGPLLQDQDWAVSKNRIERIWRREGLKVPPKQRPRGRLWLNYDSCIRLRLIHRNTVWSYDFTHHATHEGQTLRLLTLIDELTRESLAIEVRRRFSGAEMIEALSDDMLIRGIPEHIRSDNGPEMISKIIRNWLGQIGSEILFTEPSSPWENGYNENSNGKLRERTAQGRNLL